MGQRVKVLQLAVTALLCGTVIAAGCGSNEVIPSGFFPDAGDSGHPTDATGSRKPDSTMLKQGGGCVPPTCAELGANCGAAVTDTKCNGPTIDCSQKPCPTGETCGGGGHPNQCGTGGGSHGDACAAKQTCESQNITCGAAGDGCGGTIQCGTCTLPQTCGGAGNGKQECGCTGLCAQIPNCNGDAGAGGMTTSISGKVYDPNGSYPLYNALVYVPNDPGVLAPFPAGITCDVCGVTAAGNPLVSTNTDVTGSFTLTGLPVGQTIPLVIQLGRWRRQFSFPITNACGPNTIPASASPDGGAGKLTMPHNHNEGDLPRIAIVTGAYDPLECMLLKIGIDQSEFGDPGGPNYISFYYSDGTLGGTPGTPGPGAIYDLATPDQDALFEATGGPGGGPVINNYDITMLECEGYDAPQPMAQQTAIAAYAGAGGRVFTSDFGYEWLYQNPDLQSAASWAVNATEPDGNPAVGLLDGEAENPVGPFFRSWLENLGTVGDAAIGMLASEDYENLRPVFSNTTAVVPPTQQWIHSRDQEGDAAAVVRPIFFTFNTPINVPDGGAASQCGRVAFSDWHAQYNVLSGGTTFPAACPGGALTAQELMLEFLLFDLSACVQPYTPLCTPTTCGAQGIQCGAAGDGCGNPLDCGPCPTGMTCGGGGPGKCGTSSICTPETCVSEMIQCGPAGDGCGNPLNCGNCATGDICGLGGPGICGEPAK